MRAVVEVVVDCDDDGVPEDEDLPDNLLRIRSERDTVSFLFGDEGGDDKSRYIDSEGGN